MIAFACEKVTAAPPQLTVLAASLLPEQDAIISNAITTIHEIKNLILILISLPGIIIQLISTLTLKPENYFHNPGFPRISQIYADNTGRFQCD